MSRNMRIALIAGAVIVAVVAFVALQPGDDDNDTAATTPATTTNPTTPTAPMRPKPKPLTLVRVQDGHPVGDVMDIKAKKGDLVAFEVTSNVKDQVHVHGYDIEKDVPAGGRVKFSFRAKLEGVFDVEAHSTDDQIASLRVSP